MQSIAHRFSESQNNVIEHGEALWSRTRAAAGGFLGTTRDAGFEFVSQTRGASSQLVEEGRAAGLEFVNVLRSERALWVGLAGDFGSEWTTPLQRPVNRLDDLLVAPIRSAVQEWRVRAADSSAEVDVATEAEDAELLLPIAGYDLLTAREVVASLQGLSFEELVQVQGYEEANKGRVTVARAINSRLKN